MGVLKSKLFTEGNPAVIQKLENCATGRPNEVQSHFTRNHSNSRGEHIVKVQQALKNIQRTHPGFGIPDFDVNGVYDEKFAKAIYVYKQKRDIRNYAHKIDDIIGIKTIKTLDSDNANSSPDPNPHPNPKPKPEPPSPEVLDAWFVTEFSGRSESLVVLLGYSAMTGNIKFKRADGTEYRGSIGLFGLSAGVSLDPGKMPGMKTALKRFPLLLKWLGGEVNVGDKMLKWVMTQGTLQRIIAMTPGGMQIFNALKDLIAGGSVAPDWAPSAAIGMVFPFAPPLNTNSFSGACLCYSLTGTVLLGNIGTYILFFGYRGDMFSTDFSLSKFRGCAIISGAGAQLQFPGLAATGTVFVGEIT